MSSPLETFSHRGDDFWPKARDQGSQGTCAVFSVVSAVEALMFKGLNVRKSYSRQQVIDHIVPTQVPLPNAQAGAFPGTSIWSVIKYVEEVGLLEEGDYHPYDGYIRPRPLDLTKVAVKNTKYKAIANDEPPSVKNKLIKGNMVVGEMRRAWPSLYKFRGNGVYEGPTETEKERYPIPRGHGLLITGFGFAEDKLYYETLNSGGESRGDQGFIKIRRDQFDMLFVINQVKEVIAIPEVCMGGALALASSVLIPEVDAVVTFYGVCPTELADPVHAKAPDKAHFSELDQIEGFSDVKVVNAA